MNTPEKTYKKELFKWAQYLYPIYFDEETQSIESKIKNIMREEVITLQRVTIIEVCLKHPKGGQITMTHEESNKKINDSKIDLIEHWKEKLWTEIYRSVILNGLKAIHKSTETHGT